MDGSLTTLGYSGGRKATIDVTNLIWRRASIQSFNLFAQPPAAWVDAWNAIPPSASIRRDQTDRGQDLSAGEAADALRYLVEGRPFGRVVLTIA